MSSRFETRFDGPGSERLRPFEVAIACFRPAERTKALVLYYDRFRAAVAGPAPSLRPSDPSAQPREPMTLQGHPAPPPARMSRPAHH
ncbi:MAG: hypothetical protein MUE73_02260 [Planctomycetes bacterium]|nr:hypothetical protein [Planctomycetota bacterium]